jgi:hypothetical protein
VIKCGCVVQLLVPSYGYCPLPPEQQSVIPRSYSDFNNREKTPFPGSFCPEWPKKPLVFTDDEREADD